ncbi:imidazole glycerol phosphate synthase subunit HisH [Gracilimonas halophila]|uniref:Imidazole glycerol phosphate synthase subunit HisH n=1 Tax=Gracilimonas halophila TaxID=1834464 RepID=A0ABW5JKD0_9BACT
MIGIINYGSGNIQAILNIYKRLNIHAFVANTSEDISKAEKLILPGVGAFDETMEKLVSSGLIESLNEQVLEKKIPVLGICVGMQVMAKKSDEGEREGLGWFDAEVKKLNPKNKDGESVLLPHMGWNSVQQMKDNLLFKGIDPERGFYFLHSYHFVCNNEDDVLAKTNYGNIVTSALSKDNIFGTQFHPEKSHINGIQIFRNFSEL